MKPLEGMGEDELIARLVRLVPTGQAEEGPGDDCAVMDDGGMNLVLLKTKSFQVECSIAGKKDTNNESVSA